MSWINKKRTFVGRQKFVFFGADEGTCAFSVAPRSDVFNVVLCLLSHLSPNLARQSVLLSQNGSHPQIPSLLGYQTKKKNTPNGCSSFWCGRRDLNPHGVTHRNLKPARLPISPRPRYITEILYALYFRFCQFSVFAL